MKYVFAALMLIGSFAVSGGANAQSDDLKWVAKCIQDNAAATVGADVVAKYCACMNEKMDSNETQSISTWEKTHPTEMKACEAASGWK
ncbi:hypothetical protein JZU48_03770 [bacterium]|nr:hypothetical protein [bacterium]